MSLVAILFPLHKLASTESTLIEQATTEGSVNIAALISAGIFLLVFIAISFHLLHETAAALLGAVTILLLSYIGGHFNPTLSIITFEEAMKFVDWNVIFLIMGMMIFMAILAETNVFKWIAFHLYQRAKGNIWLVVLWLVLLTGITSAFLNNVTAILLIVPLSIQLAVALGIDPFAVVIAEVLASNIGGAATLIGDPPSTIVGSHIGLGFTEYMINMAPVAILCLIALIVINRFQYRKEYAVGKKSISPALVEKMESESHIVNYSTLNKALLIGSLTFGLFFVADYFSQMPPSVVALSGAALLIMWVRPNLEDMLREVDWTTLIFFIALFIVVGGMEATGAIDWLATRILALAGESLTRAVVLTTWISGVASGIVANIPYTVAALPIVDVLNVSIPGAAESHILDWSLILGADLGGNFTYIGSAAGIVVVGLLAQAGYRMSFSRFLRDSVPVTVATLIITTIWLLLRF